MEKFKLNSGKILGLFVTLLGLAGTVLSTKVDEINQKEMKVELKDEILKELSKKN